MGTPNIDHAVLYHDISSRHNGVILLIAFCIQSITIKKGKGETMQKHSAATTHCIFKYGHGTNAFHRIHRFKQKVKEIII